MAAKQQIPIVSPPVGEQLSDEELAPAGVEEELSAPLDETAQDQPTEEAEPETPEVPETPEPITEPAPEEEVYEVDIDGQKYDAEALRRAIDAERNRADWQRKLTQQSQELAEIRRAQELLQQGAQRPAEKPLREMTDPVDEREDFQKWMNEREQKIIESATKTVQPQVQSLVSGTIGYQQALAKDEEIVRKFRKIHPELTSDQVFQVINHVLSRETPKYPGIGDKPPGGFEEDCMEMHYNWLFRDTIKNTAEAQGANKVVKKLVDKGKTRSLGGGRAAPTSSPLSDLANYMSPKYGTAFDKLSTDKQDLCVIAYKAKSPQEQRKINNMT